MFENPLVLPKYQNLYGQGSAADWDAGEYEFEYVDGAYGGVNDGVDESWGPDLTEGLFLSSTAPMILRQVSVLPTPWIAHPDNIKSFFETGVKRTTNVAVSGAREGANFPPLSRITRKSKVFFQILTLPKTVFSLMENSLLHDKITVGGSANYISNKSDNIAENGYNGGNPMQSLSQWFGRQVDMKVLKRQVGGIQILLQVLPFNWNQVITITLTGTCIKTQTQGTGTGLLVI